MPCAAEGSPKSFAPAARASAVHPSSFTCVSAASKMASRVLEEAELLLLPSSPPLLPRCCSCADSATARDVEKTATREVDDDVVRRVKQRRASERAAQDRAARCTGIMMGYRGAPCKEAACLY